LLMMRRSIKASTVGILLLFTLIILAPKSLSQQPNVDIGTQTQQKLISVKSIISNVIFAPKGQVYFIVADPYRMRDLNNPMAAYDTASAGIIYGKTNATQNFGFDADSRWVQTDPNDPYKGKPKLSNKTLVLLGGYGVNICVRYYEKVSGETPLLCLVTQDVNGTIIYGFYTNKWYTKEPNAVLVAYTTPAKYDPDHRELFVIESFTDNDLNKVYILYGLGWKGTWAAGIYFKERYGEIANLDKCCYVFEWVDKERDGYRDGYPQPDEVTMIYAYHYA